MAEITRQVGASSDDCYNSEVGHDWSLTSAIILAGYSDSSWNRYGGGMRFTNITIPKGATINQAYLTLRASYFNNKEVVNTRISAEDVDDAVTFADDRDAFIARWNARTAARVDWDAIPAWTTNGDYDSAEIKTVIKEIVDREGWNSGQAIVIFWEDFEGRSTENINTRRRAFSYNGSAEFAPKLVIDYTVGVTHELTVTDGIEVGEALIKNPILILADGVALSDVLIKNPILTLIDGIRFTDVWEGYRLLSRVFTDGIAFTDTLVRSIVKILSDGIAIGEALERWWSQHYERTFTDGIAFTDTLVKRLERVLTDGIKLGDQLIKTTIKTFTDAIALRDVLTRSIAKVLTDGIAFTDALWKVWTHRVLRILRAVRNLLSIREDGTKR